MGTDQWIALATVLFLIGGYGVLMLTPRTATWEKIGFTLMFGSSIAYIALHI